MYYELIYKVRSSLALTSEDLHDNFLTKKTHRNFLPEPYFHVNCQNLFNKNGLLRCSAWDTSVFQISIM